MRKTQVKGRVEQKYKVYVKLLRKLGQINVENMAYSPMFGPLTNKIRIAYALYVLGYILFYGTSLYKSHSLFSRKKSNYGKLQCLYLLMCNLY